MDALIMAGGEGKRMGNGVLKPLVPFRGRPMIEWVIDAASSCVYVESVFVALTPKTAWIKESLAIETIETSGAGYVEDVVFAMQSIGLEKTLVLSADLPFVTSSDLAWVVEEYERLGTPALAVYVPASLYKELGLEPSTETDGLVPTGVNIVDGRDINGEESRLVTVNPSFAFNINTPLDLKIALDYTLSVISPSRAQGKGLET